LRRRRVDVFPSALGATTESRGACKIGVRAPACLALLPVGAFGNLAQQPTHTTTHGHLATTSASVPRRAPPNEVRTIAVDAVISRPGSQSALRSMVREEPVRQNGSSIAQTDSPAALLHAWTTL